MRTTIATCFRSHREKARPRCGSPGGQRANQRWTHAAAAWNAQRTGLARAERMPEGNTPPPPFAHLALHGEVRTEWEPTSTLYNTDGQVFSDLGVPVVLLMENYDTNRTGYHDTLDTMANIDLDYCAAMIAIAIERLQTPPGHPLPDAPPQVAKHRRAWSRLRRK